MLLFHEAFFLLEDVTTRIQVKRFHQGATVSHISSPLLWEKITDFGAGRTEKGGAVDGGEKDHSRWSKILGNGVGWEGKTYIGL